MGIAGNLVALGVLVLLAYRGVSVLVLAPLAALTAVVSEAGTPLLASYRQVLMPAAGGFVAPFFPVVPLGAVFGRFLEDSGAAGTISRAFVVYRIGAEIFRQADIPKRLMPANIALGAFTFTMTALPGSPAIQIAIPMSYFDSTPFAVPGLGFVAGLVMVAIGILWLQLRVASARRAGEGYTDFVGRACRPPLKDLREHAQGEGYDLMEFPPQTSAPADSGRDLFLAPMPIVVVGALKYVFLSLVFPRLDADYLALPRYGATSLASVNGI